MAWGEGVNDGVGVNKGLGVRNKAKLGRNCDIKGNGVREPGGTSREMGGMRLVCVCTPCMRCVPNAVSICPRLFNAAPPQQPRRSTR